ncbi:MAG: tetratricopeptide repeat protein [Pseudomonadota bacterium]
MSFFEQNAFLADWLALAVAVIIGLSSLIAWLLRKRIKDTRIKDQLEQEVSNWRKRHAQLEVEKKALLARIDTETGAGFLEKLEELETAHDFDAIDELAETYFDAQSQGLAETARVLARQSIERSSEDGLPALEEADRFLKIGLAARPGRRDLIDLSTAVTEKREILEGDDPELIGLLQKADTGSLYRAARTLNSRGKYPLSCVLSERLVAIVERDVGPRNLDIARALSLHAWNLVHLIRPTEALSTAQQSADIFHGFLGEDEPELLQALVDLAQMAIEAGEVDVAISSAKKAINATNNVEYDSPRGRVRARAWRTLGVLNRKAQNSKDSVAAFRRSLRILRSQEKPDNNLISQNLNSLAVLYNSEDKNCRAEILYKKALDFRVNELGNDHPSTAEVQFNLGDFYLKVGRFNEAKALLASSLETLESTLGDTHPTTMRTKHVLDQVRDASRQSIDSPRPIQEPNDHL